jgi:hypothetical protein
MVFSLADVLTCLIFNAIGRGFNLRIVALGFFIS